LAFVGAGDCTAAGWGCAAGLIQQAWTRPLKLSGTLGIDRSEAHQTAKSRLDMAARAAKPVVKIEVTECGVEVRRAHQNHHTAAEPNAFGVSGRAVNGLRRFHEFVGLALIVLGASVGAAGFVGLAG